MEVIVKSSPKIEIEFATKVVKIGSEVTVDSALSTESENPVQNKVITEELNKKATSEALDALSDSVASLEGEVVRKGDYSPENKVGLADDLAGRGESVPASFGFRASGGKSIKDGRAYIKRIKGNSVVWNNYFDIEKISVEGGTMSRDGNKIVVTATGEYPRIVGYTANLGTIPKGDVVLITFNADKELRINFPSAAILGQGYANGYEWQFFVINEYSFFTIYHDAESYTVGNIRIIDLTKMFGAGNEPSTIEEFYARVATLGVDMNAYNEGQVIHCNTESIKSVGDNAWDEEWELGSYNVSTGVPVESIEYIRSKSDKPIKVLPNTEYYIHNGSAIGQSDIEYYSIIFFYDSDDNFIKRTASIANAIFTTPQNCDHIRFYNNRKYGTTYNHDIMISLVHSGWKQDTDAGYQPYWQDTLPLPIIRKYFPQGMKSAGSAHDEIRFNKTTKMWEYSKGKIKSVDMGTLNWDKTWYTENEKWRIYANLPSKVKGQNNLLTKKYVTPYTANATMPDISITGNIPNSYIYIKDTSYSAQGADALIASLQGVILYYESNDWEWVELDAEDQNFRDYYNVADFGTEQSQSSVPSANFSADIIYQFNAVDMIREHELEITELQNVIATMQAQLTALTNGGQ